MNTLHMMIGLPRSGKSTAARKMGFPIVETDAIRQVLHGTPWKANVEPLVWAHAHIMVEALFHAGHTDVILDATNHNGEMRNRWMSDLYVREFHLVDTPVEECIIRAKQHNQHYLIPVIEQMYKTKEWPI